MIRDCLLIPACLFALLLAASCDKDDASGSSKDAPAAGNSAPVAANDAIQVAEDASVEFDPIANDTDADGDALLMHSFDQPAHGTLTPVGLTLRYSPDPDFHGSDTFTYVVRDVTGLQATGTVVIAVLPVNDAPVAGDDAASTLETLPVDMVVLGNDADVDGDTLYVSAVTQPANGSANLLASGQIRYTPAAGFTGTDAFAYTCSDATGSEDAATVTVTVNPLVWSPASSLSLAAGFGTWGAVNADFNLDGASDLASYNSSIYGPSSVSVFLNTGSSTGGVPSFTRADYTADLGARMVCADVNADGLPDLLVGSGFTGFQVLMNNPANPGSFVAAARFSAGFTWDIACGDMDGDGLPDVAVTVTASSSDYVVLFRNYTATGSMTPVFYAIGSYAVGTYAMGVAIGDLNGDGLGDVAVSNEATARVHVLVASMSGGTLSHAAQAPVSVSANPRNLGIADLDGDGRNDIAVCCYGGWTATGQADGNLDVLRNVTSSGVTTVSMQHAGSWATSAGGGTYALDFGTLDGDSRIDVVVGNWGGTVATLLNRSVPGVVDFSVSTHTTTTYSGTPPGTQGTECYGVAVGDWNGDGVPEIAHTSDTQGLGHGTVNILVGQR